jgi:hypothetical protein
MGGNHDTSRNWLVAKDQVTLTSQHHTAPRKPGTVIHTIFEGTSEIQSLVTARVPGGFLGATAPGG